MTIRISSRACVSPPAHRSGTTRTDLMAALAVLALLGSLALPLLTAAQSKSREEACRDNLQSLGKAFQGYYAAYGQRMPWRLAMKEGGTYDLPLNGNAWIQFAWLSNFIASPNILACPDDSARPATEWSRKSNGGFWHPNYRAHAVSYFVGLDVKENAPASLLSGDAHLEVSASLQSCDYANVKSAASLKPGDSKVRWTSQRHQRSGNILYFDGQVDQLSSKQLRQALPKTKAYHPDNHVLLH